LIRRRSFCLLYDLYKLQYDNSMNNTMMSSMSGEIIILSIACARVKNLLVLFSMIIYGKD